MKASYRFYRVCYRISYVLFKLLFFYKVTGRENVPDGAAMVCANHSSYLDPIIVSLSIGISDFVHYVAKAELFKVPVLSWVITKLGAISVDRTKSDVSTIKSSLEYLRKDQKVSIFPEGRRVASEEDTAAKSGAVKIAEHTGIPIVPVYVPRRKTLFRRLKVVVGVPYYVEKRDCKRTFEDYSRLVEDLMNRIEELGNKRS